MLILKLSLCMVGVATNANAFGDMKMSFSPSKVIVTGAAGRTGKLVFSALTKDPKVETLGILRTEKSAIKLRKETKCGLDNLVVWDITSTGDIPKQMEGSEAMVICTSAVPVISKTSMVTSMLKIPLNLISGKKAFNFRDLKFKYKPGQYPEKVDYEGQVAQIDLAKKLGVEHVVIVSSMGGTDPSNFLNTIGKSEDGSGNGDILLWKRKAEKYLVESGLSYTIIHPGGLTDGPGDVNELVLDVDDELLKNEKRSISRADVANLCIAALTEGRGKKVSFDCITRETAEGTKVQSAKEALSSFLSTGEIGRAHV